MFTATRATSLRTQVGVTKLFAIASTSREGVSDERTGYLRVPGTFKRRFQYRACSARDALSPGGASDTTGELPTGVIGGFAVLAEARVVVPAPFLAATGGADIRLSRSRRITAAADTGVWSDSSASWVQSSGCVAK